MSAWTPAKITTALWLDASDAATVTLSGSAVTEWVDKSLNSYSPTQATSGNRPTHVAADLNSLDVISFDGTNDSLSFGSNGLGQNVSSAVVYMVHKWATEPTALKVLFQVQSGANNTRIGLSAGSTSKKAVTTGRRLDSNAGVSVTSSADVGTAWKIRGAAFDFANSNLYQYINGVVDGYTISFQLNGNTSNTASPAFYVGTNTTTNYANAKIAELIVVHNDVTDATRELIEGYLAWKWGLEANLPVGHPYESAAPEVDDPEATISMPGILETVSTPSVQGFDLFSTISMPGILETVSAPAVSGFIDISSAIPADATIQYVMDITTPGGVVRVPVSSWQATLRAGSANYVQCVVPGAAAYPLDEATLFSIYRVAIFSGQSVEFLVASAEPVLDYAEGTSSNTCTISGYSDGFVANDDPPDAFDRQLVGVNTVFSSSTGVRVTCSVDWLLTPGLRAIVDDDLSLLVSYISYYVNETREYMIVGERF